MAHPQSSEHVATFGGEAAESIAIIGRNCDELIPLFTGRNWRIRANAARALGGLKDSVAVESLIALLSNIGEQWQVRGNASLALGEMGDPRAVNPIINMLNQENGPFGYMVVLRGLQSLSRLGHKGAAEMLKKYGSPLSPDRELWDQNKRQFLVK